MKEQDGMHTGAEKIVGKWSVYDVTARFKDTATDDIRKALAGIDQGDPDISAVVEDDPARAMTITVDLRPGGEMEMAIRRSMQPDLPATMTIRAAIEWSLDGDRMTTRPNPKSLAVKIKIDGGSGLKGPQIAEAEEKAAGIEAGALQGMRGDPLWNNANVVTVLHAGPRTFLTRASTGNLMLHMRNDSKNDEP